MSDRLDKEMSKQIREVFDAYDEPYDPLNWQRLQRKRRSRVVSGYLRWLGAAASVALLITAGVLLMNQPQVGDESQFIADSEFSVRPETGDGTDPVASSGELPETDGESATETVAVETIISGRNERPVNAVDRVEPETNSSGQAIASRMASGKAQSEVPVAADPEASDVIRDLPGEVVARQEPLLPADRSASAGEPLGVDHEVESGRELADDQALLAGEEAERTNQREEVTVYAAGDETAERSRGRFSVGLVTTSLMNYANGNSASQVHFGAGITSGWRVNDRLSVHSGLILAENSLSLDRSNSSVRESTYAMDRAANTELSAVGKNSIVQAVSPNSMDVSLLVVDIPFNVTYRVGLGSSNLLLTGGLSSFAYLDQQYSYHNTMQLYTNASVEAPEPLVRQEKAFSHFDFARQLNLAIGTEVPLGKGSVLILEPYVKYPLGELTSEQIRFGSAGMNLRFSFGGR